MLSSFQFIIELEPIELDPIEAEPELAVDIEPLVDGVAVVVVVLVDGVDEVVPVDGAAAVVVLVEGEADGEAVVAVPVAGAVEPAGGDEPAELVFVLAVPDIEEPPVAGAVVVRSVVVVVVVVFPAVRCAFSGCMENMLSGMATFFSPMPRKPPTPMTRATTLPR